MSSEKKLYRSYEDLPLALSAEDIAEILNISRTKAYYLFHREDFPFIRFGRRQIVPRDLFFAWMRKQIANYDDYAGDLPISFLSSTTDNTNE